LGHIEARANPSAADVIGQGVKSVVSPYVSRRRLATELLQLREEQSYSSAEMSDASGVPRQRISRLENGHVRPDLDEIMRLLRACGVDQARWEQLMDIARRAQAHGWWEKYADEMGPRQALYANLEAGAASICEYQMSLLPGLLQIPSYTEVRIKADRHIYPRQFDPTRAAEARTIRQEILDRPSAPSYEVVIDELAIRRMGAPPPVMAAQFDHIIATGHNNPDVNIRVLPLTVAIDGHAIPRSAFYTYRYPDPGDPIVVVVDTITSDLVLVNPAEVSHYVTLYQRLRASALGPADTLDFLAALAEDLPHEIGATS
jgi:transcriptional regulator with XRE-family HTH domain